jgi:hypothetical protein
MFKPFLALLVSVFVALAVTVAPVAKPVPAAITKPKPATTTMILKPDTTLYFSANHDTLKMVKIDSIWITKHFIDSMFFIKADTIVKSSKPALIKK